MARQPVRLSDFQIPRGEGGFPTDTFAIGEVDKTSEAEAAPAEPEGEGVLTSRSYPSSDTVGTIRLETQAPVKIAARPPVEPRQAMTVRLPISLHERMRVAMFATRRSQQDLVEEAIDLFLKTCGT
jgi:hypothetical protein